MNPFHLAIPVKNLKVTCALYKEALEREWNINGKILRPKHSMVGHTGFIVSGRYII